MLGLNLKTDPYWASLVEEQNINEILTDHAYCEMKAASQCMSLIQSYPEKKELVERLMPIVTEEWGHFRQVLKELYSRGADLGRQRKDSYVNLLIKSQPKNVGDREGQLLERLMMCALIEARSCERFKVLSENIKDKRMADFYHGFMTSEAGHYRLFMDIARIYFDAGRVKERWSLYLAIEEDVINKLSPRGDRVH
jgi:tRNA-(ms[2]io[6]A)-hydroxylase